ncbi:MAG: hypothetical protein JJ916_04025 [Phycisphaerales bacterium]|nr:hypothetical protein [Phycisphaerales bacterium]
MDNYENEYAPPGMPQTKRITVCQTASDHVQRLKALVNVFDDHAKSINHRANVLLGDGGVCYAEKACADGEPEDRAAPGPLLEMGVLIDQLTNVSERMEKAISKF